MEGRKRILGGYAIESWGDLKLVTKIQSIGTMVIRAYAITTTAANRLTTRLGSMADRLGGGFLTLLHPVEKFHVDIGDPEHGDEEYHREGR